MSTYDAWFPRCALRNRLMFSCQHFSPAVGQGSSALSTFLNCRTQRVKPGLHIVVMVTSTVATHVSDSVPSSFDICEHFD